MGHKLPMGQLNSVILSNKPATAPGSTVPSGLSAPAADGQPGKDVPAFAGILKSKLADNVVAKSGNTLPEEPQPKKTTDQAKNTDAANLLLESRLLQSGLKVIVGGATPSDAGIDDFARSQGIDPKALASLMADSKNEFPITNSAAPKTALAQPKPEPELDSQSEPQPEPVAAWLTDSAISQLVAGAPVGSSPGRQSIEAYLQAPSKFTPLDKPAQDVVEKMTFNLPTSKAMNEIFSGVNTNPQHQPVIKLENINLAVKDGIKDPLKATHLKSNDSKIALLATAPVTTATVPVTLASVAAPAVISESGYITSPPTFDDRSEYSAADTLPEKLEQQTLRKQEEQADMSRRLAEALGQRLTAQISRGAWRVEMDLHPKSLGRIEIQLEMKNGELEANFTAANAATRELIQESMPRLRAAFEEHGMESAYIGLGLENQGQSDGKPTGQNSPNEAKTTSDSEEPQLNARTSRLDDDGLDLLV
jgi:flagellar hook-length control protein FliK